MALRKTALIRAPQLRRRPRWLCQSTCHGFPPAIRTRAAAWAQREPATSHQLSLDRGVVIRAVRASANPYGAPENRLDPRPSAPPPTRAAMPKHLPRFSSGHTDSLWRGGATVTELSRPPRASLAS